MTNTGFLFIVALSTSLAAASAAYAQSTPGPAGSDQVIPEKQAPGRVSPPHSGAPAKAGRSLSDTLSKSNGVIKPPVGVDRKMNRPAPVPHPNSTPVIPPPGSPGAKSQAQPK
ncbi:MAG TPA: hypothetical protein VMU56_08170 [Beijerinckiaceae bacterium]|nr:hypothetical protein [Beijerinckiaceae bacterium]